MTPNKNKLYVVTRQDLSPGYQIVQSCHAVENLARRYPDEITRHGDLGNTMVCLAARNEHELVNLWLRMTDLAKTTIFWETDVNQFTAFAVSPSEHYHLLAHLPLAGRDVRRKRWPFR